MARPKKEAAVVRDLNTELNVLTGQKILKDNALDIAYETILSAMTDKNAPAATNLNAAKSMFALAEEVKENLAKNLTEGDFGNERIKAEESLAKHSKSTLSPLISMGDWGQETIKPN